MKINLEIQEIYNEEIREVEQWLISLSSEAYQKISTVIKVLKTYGDLGAASIIDIPSEALKLESIDVNSQKTILNTLWKNGIITVFIEPKSYDADPFFEWEPGLSISLDDFIDIESRKFKHIYNKILGDADKIIVFPHNSDHIYQNGTLHLRLKDGTPCSLDLSTATKLRPVFESFYFLYQETGDTLFSSDQLLEKHKQLSKEDVLWRKISKRKSAICGKMINKKPALKKRISWFYDKSLNKYKFEILRLSDK